MEGLQPVNRAEHVRDQRRFRPVDEAVDEDLEGQQPRGGAHLTAASQAHLLLRHRHEAPAVTVQRVTAGHHEEGHRLQTAVEHDRTRHAAIVLEVSLEEPGIWLDRHFHPQIAAAPRAALRIERRNVPELHHLRRRQVRRADMAGCAQERLTEYVAKPAGDHRADGRGAEAARDR